MAKFKPWTIPNPKLRRHPKLVYKNRVEASIVSDIGDLNLSFGFKGGVQAQDFFDLLMECEHCCGASLFQDGRFNGGMDGKQS